jgi:hypothetical protein
VLSPPIDALFELSLASIMLKNIVSVLLLSQSECFAFAPQNFYSNYYSTTTLSSFHRKSNINTPEQSLRWIQSNSESKAPNPLYSVGVDEVSSDLIGDDSAAFSLEEQVSGKEIVHLKADFCLYLNHSTSLHHSIRN